MTYNEPLFIAEVSSNHSQNLDRCMEFIETASDIGCWGIKFQLFKIEELFSPEILNKSPYHRNRKNWELPIDFIPPISNHCRKNKIRFGCTPFYLNAVKELFDFVDFYKIASYEILWKELLIECAKTNKPVMLSTGMAKVNEIINAVELLINYGCNDLTIFHCVSGYPAPANECNLAAINTVRNLFAKEKRNIKLNYGWSDHSVDPGVIYRAVHHWNAEAIEFHLDSDGMGEEFSIGHCWLPDDIREVVRSVRNGFLADGNGVKEPRKIELPDREWRADPEDGLRPLKHVRMQFNE